MITLKWEWSESRPRKAAHMETHHIRAQPLIRRLTPAIIALLAMSLFFGIWIVSARYSRGIRSHSHHPSASRPQGIDAPMQGKAPKTDAASLRAMFSLASPPSFKTALTSLEVSSADYPILDQSEKKAPDDFATHPASRYYL